MTAIKQVIREAETPVFEDDLYIFIRFNYELRGIADGPVMLDHQLLALLPVASFWDALPEIFN